ncbi:zinc finger protein 438 [Hippocampus zosterae]|uniref:zinc finger protein 438 n=1 Tax=Hippocampus zosterae TaxID=109293 RepID=UPI00223E0C62|nr:zinc finger protein 438 [Hippocampus zosterae]XP_051910956.1 zinc finger protein 438 [Hippocampus zosterae]
MKSLQFRNIAPKAPVIVPSPSSALLACQPPPAPLEANSGSSPKSIVVPTQNYALMQIAGQDGTFSLVALPPPVSSQTTQQQPSQQTQSIQKNLKLPIPRYKPARRAGPTEKVRSTPIARRVKTASGVGATKKPLSATSLSSKEKKEECAVTQSQTQKEEPSEQVIFIDPARSEISVPTLLPDNAVLYPGSQLEQAPHKAEQSAMTGVIQNLCPPSTLPAALKTSPGKSLEQSGTMMGMCQAKPASAQPANSITVISPAIFGKAVQIIPSPPQGKLPILPYSKMKTALIPAAKLNVSQDNKDCLNQSGPMSPKDPTSSMRETSQAWVGSQVPNSSHQPQSKNPVIPLLGNLQKLPGKKRGRKRKTMEDILAYEARKKRSLSFFRRRVPEKPSMVGSGSKEKEVDISKKYRSIQPKPLLVMEALPQLLSLPASSSDGQEPELVPSHQPPTPTKERDRPPQHPPVSLHLSTASHPRILVAGRLIHRCPTCSRCFQFKHHLQSHMNSHTNSRPYVCLMCRKAYAHSGSLSTHMKLHHSEARSHGSLSCEFCRKAFGYVGVYFSHLREVHKVLLTVEGSIKRHENDVAVKGDNSEALDEQDPEECVELQIKCGRCQVVTSSFADMKMHLVYVHGEEVMIQLQAGQPSPGDENTEEKLVKRAAHYWRQLNKKRNLVKCGNCDEEFFSFAQLKRHILFHHRGSEGDCRKTAPTSDAIGCLGILAAGSAFNCVLCSQVLKTKEEVLEHWRAHHHCEQPSLLWAALSSYSGLQDDEADGGLDTPVPSPH